MGVLATSTLVGVCILVAGTLLAMRHGAIREDGARGVLLRHMAVAAITAVLCAVMYLADQVGASALTFAIANGSMVFAPAMIWVALRRVNGRGGAAALIALALALAAALVTPFSSTLVAGGVKVALLTAVCALVAVETSRPPVSGLRGAALIRVVAIGYAGFCALRLAAGAALGLDAIVLPWQAVTQVTTILGIVSVVLVGVGAWRMAAQLGRDGGDPEYLRGLAGLRPLIAERLAAGTPLSLCVLSLPELPLIRAAHGSARAEQIETAMLRAVRDASPPGTPQAMLGRGCVAVPLSAPDATAERAELLRRRFDELTPLVAHEDLPEIRIERIPVDDIAAFERMLPRQRFGRLGYWKIAMGRYW